MNRRKNREEEIDIITLSKPETDQEFWQQVYLKRHLYEHFNNRGYKQKLRQEIDEECIDYLEKLNEIAYQDDYLTSYVQGVFAKLNTITIDANRGENLNIRLIQSPEPDAFMLPNGSMVVSTGLLCTLDSEDELAAVIACELAHFVLDHQVNNIYVAERRAQRAAFWADVFTEVSNTALDVAYWDDNDNAYAVSLVADIGLVTSLLSIPATDRLGMTYKTGQEVTSDELATDNDYIIFVKAQMALSNTEETNNKCLSMLDKAQELVGENHNLDIYKQRILLLMRMNKQAKAASTLKEYLTLLTQYQSQGIEGE